MRMGDPRLMMAAEGTVDGAHRHLISYLISSLPQSSVPKAARLHVRDGPAGWAAPGRMKARWLYDMHRVILDHLAIIWRGDGGQGGGQAPGQSGSVQGTSGRRLA